MSSEADRPMLLRIWERVLNVFFLIGFPGSAQYWDLRYRLGGTSGAGSYGADMRYKAVFLNEFIERHRITSVIDFGCGDGNQLGDLKVERYCGFDVSDAAIRLCRKRFFKDPSKDFFAASDYRDERADAAISMDVIYHLVEDSVFNSYLDRLFGAADRFVVIYASNDDMRPLYQAPHVKHRTFVPLVLERYPQFQLIEPPARPAALTVRVRNAISFFVFARK